MNFFKKIYQDIFPRKQSQHVVPSEPINLTELVQNIQKQLIDTEQSHACVGIQYIEKFFEQEIKPSEKKTLKSLLNDVCEAVASENTSVTKQRLLQLKTYVNEICSHTQGNTSIYRPKMTSFEMPVLKNDIWIKESIEVPLFALSPVSIPKIKEITFIANLDYVKSEGDDVYVRLQQDQDKRYLNEKENKTGETENTKNATQIKISFSPEQDLKELNEVIAQYKKVLRKK
jgi:hypothetical protein